ncbi:MAG: DUF3047 domain-containing protein [Burkholderiaceae bacterium]
MMPSLSRRSAVVFALCAACGAMPSPGAAAPPVPVGVFPEVNGEPPAPWKVVLRGHRLKPTRYRTMVWDGVPAIEARADASMALLARPVEVDLQATPILCWRWRIDGVVPEADMTSKDGDDYAARVYVGFRLPKEMLGMAERARLAMARNMFGEETPDVAVVYVWDNRNPVGTNRPNAYTDHAQMIVQRSGDAEARRWLNERVDVLADVTRAFGNRKPAAFMVALATDTDDTGARARAGYADLHFVARDTPCATGRPDR